MRMTVTTALAMVLALGCATPLARPPRPMDRTGFEDQSRDPLLLAFKQAARSHFSGDYEDSNRAIEQAIRIADLRPAVSVRGEAGTLLLRDGAEGYRGYAHERIMLHALSMLNYSFLNRAEDALIEARRFDELATLLKQSHGEKALQVQGAFDRILSGLLYENTGHHDDALIDYRQARKTFARTVTKTGIPEPLFLKKIQEALESGLSKPLERGDVVVVAYEGNIPRLVRRKEDDLNAELEPSAPPLENLRLEVDGGTAGQRLEPIEDLGAALRHEIRRRQADPVRGIKVAFRETVQMAMFFGLTILPLPLPKAVRRFADPEPAAPDLRSWSSLPERVWMARLSLPPGRFGLLLRWDFPEAGSLDLGAVNLKAGQMVFKTARPAVAH